MSVSFRQFGRAAAVGILLAAAVGSFCPCRAAAPAKSIKPAFVTDFPVRDPFVLTVGETCRLYAAEGTSVRQRFGKDLKTWDAGSVVWRAEDVPALKGATAVSSPEVHAYKGAYYLFVTVDGAQGRGVWVFRAKHPKGQFVPHGKAALTPKGVAAFDGTFFEDNRVPHLVYAEPSSGDKPGRLAAVRLSDDLSQTVGEPFALFTAAAAKTIKWAGNPVVAASPALRRVVGGDLYLLWSTLCNGRAVTIQTRSQSRHLKGPWVEQKALVRGDSASPSFAYGSNGQTYLAVHQPNSPATESKMTLYSVVESVSGFTILKPETPVGLGPDYRPADFPGVGVMAGSALDMTHLGFDAPAGAYGFVRTTPFGGLEFEKRPGVQVRFQGYNGGAPWRACGQDLRGQIGEFIRRLKAQGYNCLRLSLPGMDTVDPKTGAFSYPAWALDNWFYSIAELKKAGIYVIFQVGTGRFGRAFPYSWENRDDLKCRMYLGDEEVCRHWRNIAETALTRVNPYTGTAMKDDGQFIAIECYNEQALGLDRAPRPVPGDRYDYTMALVKWYNKTLRELGWKGLITQFNYSKRICEARVRNQEEDLVISNFYFCHPIGGWGTEGTVMLQHSSYGDGLGYFRVNPGMRLPGRPFFVTEHNHCYWNRYQYEEVAVPAYAAFHDFCGLCIHEGAVRIEDAPGPASPFDVSANPVNRADEFLASMLFLRGDVTPSPHLVAMSMNGRFLKDQMMGAPNSKQTIFSLVSGFGVTFPDDATRYSVRKADFTMPAAGASGVFIEAWFTNVLDGPQNAFSAPAVVSALKASGVLTKDNATDPAKGIWESDTKELLMDTSNLTFRVNTPRTQLFAGPKGASGRTDRLATGVLPVNASVALTSLDGLPLGESRRQMLVVNTRAVNSGVMFLADEKRMATSGTTPVTLQTGVFDIAVKGPIPQAVYPLAIDGRRRAPLAVTPMADGWRLRLDTAALPDGVTPFFEVDCTESILRPGDTLVLVGDSITEIGYRSRGSGLYHQLTNAFAVASAEKGVHVVPLGFSGFQVETWRGLMARASKDTPDPVMTNYRDPGWDLKNVFRGKVDVVAIFLGMNDILKPSVTSDADALDAWGVSVAALTEDIRRTAHPREIVYCTVTPLTGDRRAPKNAVRRLMNERLCALAAKTGARVADYGVVIEDLQESLLARGFSLVPDTVHPKPFIGHTAMARELCRALGEHSAEAFLDRRLKDEFGTLEPKDRPRFVCRYVPRVSELSATGTAIVFDLSWKWIDTPAHRAENRVPEVRVHVPRTWSCEKVFGKDYVCRRAQGQVRVAAGTGIHVENEMVLTATCGGEKFEQRVRIPPPWKVGPYGADVFSSTNAAVRLVFATDGTTGGATSGSCDPFVYEFGQPGTNAVRATRGVYSPVERRVRLRFSHQTFSATLMGKIYLNGALVLADSLDRRGKNSVETEVTLRKGLNILDADVQNVDWQRQFAVDLLPIGNDDLNSLEYSWRPIRLSGM